jgi:hypothetical protein
MILKEVVEVERGVRKIEKTTKIYKHFANIV